MTYTDDARARIVAALKAGASLRDAVGFAGVPWQTFIDWLRAGRRVVDGADGATAADRRFERLALDIDQAAHESTVALTGIMRKAAEEGDWRAAEALLKIKADRAERRVRLRRGRAEAVVAGKRAEGTLVDRTDVTSGGKTIASMTDDELRALINGTGPDGATRP